MHTVRFHKNSTKCKFICVTEVITIFLGTRVEGRERQEGGLQRPVSSFGYVRHLDGVMVLVSTYIKIYHSVHFKHVL